MISLFFSMVFGVFSSHPMVLSVSDISADQKYSFSSHSLSSTNHLSYKSVTSSSDLSIPLVSLALA